MLGVSTHVAIDLFIAGETKQIDGRLPKILAPAHLALPASAVDSMEQVIGQANRDFHGAFHTRIIPQELYGHGGLASRVAKLPAEPAIFHPSELVRIGPALRHRAMAIGRSLASMRAVWRDVGIGVGLAALFLFLAAARHDRV
jgi:hypothetical protein